ncbi:MAG: hypothetical protein RIQ36_1698 [Pseudomonadota bacterium]
MERNVQRIQCCAQADYLVIYCVFNRIFSALSALGIASSADAHSNG